MELNNIKSKNSTSNYKSNVKNETIEGFMTGMPVPVLSQPSWDQCQAPNIYNGTWFIIISVWFFGFVIFFVEFILILVPSIS